LGCGGGHTLVTKPSSIYGLFPLPTYHSWDLYLEPPSFFRTPVSSLVVFDKTVFSAPPSPTCYFFPNFLCIHFYNPPGNITPVPPVDVGLPLGHTFSFTYPLFSQHPPKNKKHNHPKKHPQKQTQVGGVCVVWFGGGGGCWGWLVGGEVG